MNIITTNRINENFANNELEVKKSLLASETLVFEKSSKESLILCFISVKLELTPSTPSYTVFFMSSPEGILSCICSITGFSPSIINIL